jgi:hypothetical protein
MLERSFATEQHLVEPDRDGLADPVRIINQSLAVVVHGVHHRVPVAAEISRDLRHCAAVMADLERRPPASTIRHPGSLRGDALVDLNEGHHRARRVWASPPRLRPHQSRSPTEARQIDQLDSIDAMTMNAASATTTDRPIRSPGDRDSQPSRPVTDPIDVDVGQPDQQFTHARRIGFQQGLLGSRWRKTPSGSQSPCVAPGTYTINRIPRSDPMHRILQ